MSDGYHPSVEELLRQNERLLRRVDQLERTLHESGRPAPAEPEPAEHDAAGARQLRALVEGLPDTVVVVCNARLRILQVFGDPQVVVRDGLSACCGWPIAELLPSLDAGQQLQILAQAGLRNERAQQVISHGGRSWWCRCAPIGRGAGRSLLLISDHTDQERMMAAAVVQERLATIGTMAGGVAHEFNNLVGVIMGHVELCQTSGRLDERSQHHIDVIQRACQRSAHLAQAMLATVRGRHADAHGRCDVAAAAGQAIELFMISARQHGIAIAWTPPPTPLWADCSEGPLGQVLLNLLANAQAALLDIPDKRIAIACVRDGGAVRCTVEDNGCGIPAEDRARIFRPFHSSGRTRPGQQLLSSGTGLGLAVCQRLVNDMGGSIEVESTVGAGTAFTVVLPAAQDAAAAAPAAPAPMPPAPAGTGSRILVVEDDAAMRDLLGIVLSGAGLDVVAAGDGEEAMRLLAGDAAIRGMVLDWRMPVLDGAGVLGRMARLAAPLPVLICTGNGDEVPAALPAFVHGVVGKPFRAADLVGRIRAMLGAAHA